jgi:hypothetical protein
MQVSLDAVDWKWLLALKPRRARIDALLMSTDNVGFVETYQPAMDWIDSDNQHSDLWDLIEDLAHGSDKPTGDLLLTAWEPILSCDERFDELSLGDDSEGCFYASLAPASVRKMADALAAIDLEEMIREMNLGEDPSDLEFLQQRAAVVFLARDRGWGLVGHMG